MSLTEPQATEVFTFRTYKKLDIASDQMWANTYEMQVIEGATLTDLKVAANALVSFEKEMHQDTTQFDRVVISSYIQDGTPYNPAAFATLGVSGAGEVVSPPASEVLPLQVCLYIRRITSTGRTGRIMFRGCLGEDDVQGRYGQIQLTSSATINGRLVSALMSSGLGEYLQPSTKPLVMVMCAGVTPTNVRSITGLEAVDARLVKYNNRYFDRA